MSSFIKKVEQKKDEGIASINWNYIKNMPNIFRQKLSTEYCAIVDDEFDTMYSVFKEIVKGLHTLEKGCKSYHSNIVKLLELNLEIGVLVKDIYNPTLKVKDWLHNQEVEPSSTSFSLQEEDIMLWKEIGLFQDHMSQIEPSLEPELTILGDRVSRAVEDALQIAKMIETSSIKQRERALCELNIVKNKLAALLRSQETKELNTKQSKQIFNYERSVERCEAKYSQINNLLKTELPIYFKLVAQLFEPLRFIIYYTQLMIAYTMSSSLIQVSNVVYYDRDSSPVDCPNNAYIDAFNSKLQPAIELANQLKIIKFRDSFPVPNGDTGECQSTVPTVTETSSSTSFCEAIFSFQAQAQGDLSIKRGDVIRLTDSSGTWYKGELNGQVGIFPYNYVRIIE